jgi:hypothetical protein
VVGFLVPIIKLSFLKYMEKDNKEQEGNPALIILGIGVIVVILIATGVFNKGTSDQTNITSTEQTPSTNNNLQNNTNTTIQTTEEKQQILANQVQCSKDGSAYNLNFWHSTDNSNTVGNKYVWDTPEYHYNSKLNTCLLYERYIQYDKFSNSLSYQYDQIIDVYSNKTILTGFFTRDVSVTPFKEDVGYFGNSSNGVPNYTSDEFYRQKNLLFNQ